MRTKRIPFWIGGITLPYWGFLYIFIFRDLYRLYDSIGIVLKAVLPFALVANLIGTVVGIALFSKSKAEAGLSIILNLLPVVGFAYFIWWLFFGVKI